MDRQYIVVAYPQNSKVNILRQDLSGLFDNLSMIGILGEDCSRIDIHFTEVRKTDSREYEIKGVSRTRLSIICPFKGKVCIDSISSDFQLKSECTEVDGFIYGHYSFVEYGDKRYSGTFSGAFKQGYRMNGQQMRLYPILLQTSACLMMQVNGLYHRNIVRMVGKIYIMPITMRI